MDVTMTSLRLGTAAAALVVAIAAAPSAAMAKPPGVATNGVAPIGPRQATAHGTVNPRGQETTYYFEYGPTTAYGTQTPPTSAGAGNRVVKTAKELTGLEPQTSYHYRLVARNASGTANGADRTFNTSSQPLAFAFQAVPPFTTFGRGTTFTGSLTGTGGANRPLVLERRPFPYTSAWQTAGTQTTSPTGAFAFSVSSLDRSTDFRVRTADEPRASPIVRVSVGVKVATRVSRRVIHRGQKVRF